MELSLISACHLRLGRAKGEWFGEVVGWGNEFYGDCDSGGGYEGWGVRRVPGMQILQPLKTTCEQTEGSKSGGCDAVLVLRHAVQDTLSPLHLQGAQRSSVEAAPPCRQIHFK